MTTSSIPPESEHAMTLPRDVPTHPAPPMPVPTDDDFKLAVLDSLDHLRNDVNDLKKLVPGKAIHDINNRIAIMSVDFSRMADSYERLVNLATTMNQRSMVDRTRLDAAESRLTELEVELRKERLSRPSKEV